MIHVTCAIIQHDHKILICQRSSTMTLPLKWEFPGGKIEQGESKQECLKREIQEELGLTIEVGQALPSVEHRYPTFEITLYPFLCSLKSGALEPLEHAQVEWVSLETLESYDWAEADVPIVKKLISL
ncbi:(deoxy)nucleoside triphosphate pyrophosphohydrolase [Chryseobacterium sp. A321]